MDWQDRCYNSSFRLKKFCNYEEKTKDECATDEIFESNEKKNLKEIYENAIEYGFEDKGNITKHMIRDIIYKLAKKGKIIHVSKGVHMKDDNINSSPVS